MPKNISTNYKNFAASQATTLAMCIRIICKNGDKLGFTTWDVSFNYTMITNTDSHGPTTYHSGGFIPSEMKSDSTTAPDSLEIQGAIDSSLILDAELYQGKYDDAEITFFKVNPLSLADGEEISKVGYVGTITRTDGKYTFEILSLLSRYKRSIVQLTGPLCPIKVFCNEQCKLTAATFTHAGILAADVAPEDNVIHVTLSGLPPTVTNTTVKQINSGGGASSPYATDSGSDAGTSTETTGTTIDRTGLTNPAPIAVYQSDRYKTTSGAFTYGVTGQWSYTFTGLAPNASHKLRLHFAENHYNTVGYRVMDIAVNNVGVESSFDVYAAAGNTQFKGVIKEYTETSDGTGTIKITLTPHNAHGAFINGIEIIQIGFDASVLFQNGFLTVAGIARKIRVAAIISGSNIDFTVNESYGRAIANTTAISAFEGCDRTPQQCSMRNNIINYRGQNFLPGNPKILQQGRPN
jgi:hypothetical protein